MSVFVVELLQAQVNAKSNGQCDIEYTAEKQHSEEASGRTTKVIL